MSTQHPWTPKRFSAFKIAKEDILFIVVVNLSQSTAHVFSSKSQNKSFHKMTTGLPEVGYGILFAIISMICNGSFSSFNKLPSVVKSKVDPQIFNLYFICGCIASCILVYIVLVAMGETVTFTYLGVISGFLLALCGLTTFAAIGHIGLSVGVAIWSGTAIVVSFIEGLLIDSDLYSWPISIVGVIVLVFGIIVVSFSEVVAGCCCFDAMHRHDQSQQNNNVPASVQNGAGDGSDASVESQTLIDHSLDSVCFSAKSIPNEVHQ